MITENEINALPSPLCPICEHPMDARHGKIWSGQGWSYLLITFHCHVTMLCKETCASMRQ